MLPRMHCQALHASLLKVRAHRDERIMGFSSGDFLAGRHNQTRPVRAAAKAAVWGTLVSRWVLLRA